MAAGAPEVHHVIVSTDSPEIQALALEHGALSPWLRPAELATDTASTVDVCLHALDWYEAQHGQVDGLMLLSPTSPFRTLETIRRGVALFESAPASCVFAVTTARSHPMWCFRIDRDRMQPFMREHGLHTRSQDLPPAYIVNGAFYLIAPSRLREAKTFFIDDMVPLVLDEDQGVDLDTERDWQVAEAMAPRRDR